jgi:O-6-methylguanine DNA methyltransferase
MHQMSIKITLFAQNGHLFKVTLSLHSHFEQEWVGTPISWVNSWLTAYQQGKQSTIPINDLQFPTEFSRKVNLALLNIPLGQTLTYGELGETIDSRAYQAIGQALHYNPYPLFLPCHRILPKKGGIGGYAFGPSLKQHLLTFEKKGGVEKDFKN